MALGEFFSQIQALLFGSAEDVLRNRRNQPRLALDLPVNVELEGQARPAQVRDFGPNGLRLHMSSRLPRGRRIQVCVLPDSGLEGGESLRCRVAWCKVAPDGEGFHLGCSYDDRPEVLATSWVQMLLAQRHQRPRDRRDRRVEATIPALLLEPDVPPQSVFVLDLGLGGARVYSAQPWNPRQEARLSFGIPGLSVTVDFAIELVESSRLADGAGWSYRLRFMESDQKRQSLLRKMLLQLLEGVKKAGRSRPADLIPEPAPAKAQSTGPAGKLSGAVRDPQARSTRSRGTVSSYLKGPELPTRPQRPPRPSPPPVPVVALEPAADVKLESLPTEPLQLSGLTRMQTDLLPLEPRQRRRGWLSAALDGWFPTHDLVSDFLPRPATAWFQCLAPLLPGPAGVVPYLGWNLETNFARGYSLGPGLLWADRRTLTRFWLRHRGLLNWVEGMLRTRERLERRAINLRQRAFLLLSMLGCGGPTAVRRMILSGQVAAGLARHNGYDEPMMLSQLRLAAMLKDVGEALLLIGSQDRFVRDRYVLHWNSLEHGEPDLADLSTDWDGFDCPAELQVNRLRSDAVVLELMSDHPYVGDQLLARLGFPVEMRVMIRYHHEAWGGIGHPEGLREQDIPWGARCLALADGFAAGVTQMNSADQAYAGVAQLAGSYYDPQLVQALQLYLNELGVLQRS